MDGPTSPEDSAAPKYVALGIFALGMVVIDDQAQSVGRRLLIGALTSVRIGK
jgi:hypothetical protein